MEFGKLSAGDDAGSDKEAVLSALPIRAIRRDVFVVMPFSSTRTCSGDDWTATYEHVFKPAICAAGYSCTRAEVSTGSLIGSIVEDLRIARIVLADITDQNANVFYELGVRHALSKRTIIVAQKPDDIPSDLRGYWTIVYGLKPKEVKEFIDKLASTIAKIESNPEKADSPVGEMLDRENINVLASIQRSNAKKLTALLTEISGNINVLQSPETCEDGSNLFTSCLDLLLQTLYIDLGPVPLQHAYEAMYGLRRIVSRKGAVPLERISKTRDDLVALELAVNGAKDSLVRGQFEEPASISSLVWRMKSARFPQEAMFCNYAEDPSCEAETMQSKSDLLVPRRL